MILHIYSYKIYEFMKREKVRPSTNYCSVSVILPTLPKLKKNDEFRSGFENPFFPKSWNQENWVEAHARQSMQIKKNR